MKNRTPTSRRSNRTTASRVADYRPDHGRPFSREAGCRHGAEHRSYGKGILLRLSLVVFLFVVVCSGASLVRAEDTEDADNRVTVPDRYGMALIGGNSYSPRNDISLLMISGFALFDYEKVWHHPAPAPLRFKTELAVGTAAGSEHGPVASAGITALYYLDRLSGSSLRPYIEGGIGLIYTEFRVEGQGLHLNFNPQAGIGVEHTSGFFAAARLHHLSNGGLNHNNQGVSSVVLMIGSYLK